jgi:dihydrofolate reductase
VLPTVTQVFVEISMSLDGFVAGPNPSLEVPLGEGGERLHEWVVGLRSFRERHGMEGGETNAADELLRESVDRSGATIMGRRMFSGGAGPWEEDPNGDAWWGDKPPFGHPVFVLTHHARDPLVKQGTTFTFVTEGIEHALGLAREAAGDRDVAVAGGADVARQYLGAGLLDEIQIHLAPVLLGGGTRLFENDLGRPPPELERTRAIASPSGAAHLAYRVVR